MEMSLGLIITAIVMLLILVLVVFLLGDKFDWFNRGVKCIQEGGRCQTDQCSDSNRYDLLPHPENGCKSSAKYCCSILPKDFSP